MSYFIIITTIIWHTKFSYPPLKHLLGTYEFFFFDAHTVAVYGIYCCRYCKTEMVKNSIVLQTYFYSIKKETNSNKTLCTSMYEYKGALYETFTTISMEY